jgi:hypothetical protein
MTRQPGERLGIFSKGVGSLRDPDRHLETQTRTGHTRNQRPTPARFDFR